MTKFKEYYERMIETNKEAFDRFTKVHLQYSINPEENQEKFNEEGKRILEIIREWENKLCSQSEKAGYASYTARLSEKFWGEIRKNFPKIDYVGVIVDKKPKTSDDFFLKKINLN
jgi:hypothetical protein